MPIDPSEGEEIPFDEATLELALRNLSQDAVLVGGQALQFWFGHYGLGEFPDVAATTDMDVLAPLSDVALLAEAMGGRAVIETQPFTALNGRVVIPVSGRKCRNIDVLWKVHGFADADALKARSSPIGLDGGAVFHVLHPVDLAESKLKNYRDIAQKQTAAGRAQAELSLKIARCFILETLGNGHTRAAKRAIRDVGRLLRSPAGIHLGKSGVDLCSAIPHADVPFREFQSEFWPRLNANLRHRLTGESDPWKERKGRVGEVPAG